jgi:hypothetical protein
MADMVGLSTDIRGQVSVHDNQNVAQKTPNSYVLFKLAPCSFN